MCWSQVSVKRRINCVVEALSRCHQRRLVWSLGCNVLAVHVTLCRFRFLGDHLCGAPCAMHVWELAWQCVPLQHLSPQSPELPHFACPRHIQLTQHIHRKLFPLALYVLMMECQVDFFRSICSHSRTTSVAPHHNPHKWT